MVAGDYKSLVDTVIEKARKEKDILIALRLLLTLDGKQEFDEAILPLSNRDVKVIENLQILPEDSEQTIKLHCYFRNNKIEFSDVELLEDENCKFVLSFMLSKDRWHEICKQDSEVMRKEYKRCYSLLKKLDEAGLQQRLLRIKYYLLHMAPVIYYVGASCYSNFDYLNNLSSKTKEINRNCLLEYWLESPLEKWEENDYIFVCFTDYILNSGIQTRLEEFNGKQISLGNLEEYLEFKYYQYKRLLGDTDVEFLGDFSELELDNKVQKLKEKWEKISKTTVIYRGINGLSLQKSEEFIQNEDLLSKFVFDSDLSSKLYDTFGVKSNSLEEFQTSIKEYFQRDLSHLEERFLDLLNFIFLRLSDITHSDIAFSRYFGNVGLLIKLDSEKDYQNIISLSPKNYYCLVTPSKNMLENVLVDLLSKIGMAINSRMLYNGWHYMPGNFINCEQVDFSERDFYFSAVLSDVTNKDKYHHVGHVKLDINNCIRVPLTMTINGRAYKALMDVRTFRRGDNEYSISDLENVIIYSKYVKVIGQAIFDIITDKKDFSFALQQVNRDNYTKNLAELKKKRY